MVQPNYICRLHLYGLKQALWARFLWLNTFLLQLYFTRSTTDTSLFILCFDDYVILLFIHVGDIMLTRSHNAPFDNLLASLSREFSMKDLGPLHYFLSIEVHKQHDGLPLTQSKYIHNLLKWTPMLDFKSSSTQVCSRSHLSTYHSDPLPDPYEYCQVVGSLQYLTFTGPNISYAV